MNKKIQNDNQKQTNSLKYEKGKMNEDLTKKNTDEKQVEKSVIIQQSNDRLEILKKIKFNEENQNFNVDIENDPPTKVLLPDQIDYERKKIKNKILSCFYNMLVKKFVNKMIKQNNLIIEKIEGIENVESVKNGALITCNHFSIFDSLSVGYALRGHLHSKKLYTIIREGNYTSFDGFYGKVFKHCNTLPLSSNKDTMKKFITATKNILKKGNKILIFPEQAMWWNYKKPRPMKDGAFNLAIKNNVPIIPCFITMKDSNNLEPNGFYTQKFTLHFSKPIFAKSELSFKENIKYLREENYKVWKEIYENTYKIKLEYLKDN